LTFSFPPAEFDAGAHRTNLPNYSFFRATALRSCARSTHTSRNCVTCARASGTT